MIIEDDTIIFKSYKPMYVLEESGKKSNTVRLLSGDELDLVKCLVDLTYHIKIVCATHPNCSFTRQLTDITKIGKILGAELYVFSW